MNSPTYYLVEAYNRSLTDSCKGPAVEVILWEVEVFGKDRSFPKMLAFKYAQILRATSKQSSRYEGLNSAIAPEELYTDYVKASDAYNKEVERTQVYADDEVRILYQEIEAKIERLKQIRERKVGFLPSSPKSLVSIATPALITVQDLK